MSISANSRASSPEPVSSAHEHHIRIAGEFELVAIALNTMRSSITVVENRETHLLFTIAEGGAGIARPGEDDTVVVTVLDTCSQRVAERITAALAAVLDCPVVLERSPETKPTEGYSAAYDAAAGILVVSGEVGETDTENLGDDLRRHSRDHTRTVTVDLSGVTFLPSRAIGIIVGAQSAAKAQDAEISLRTTTGSISEKVLTIIGLPHEAVARPGHGPG